MRYYFHKKEVEREPEPQEEPSMSAFVEESVDEIRKKAEREPVDGVLEEALSFEDKRALAEAFNLLPKRLRPSAMKIIREADFVNDETKEMYIDDLNTKLQRKLQSFVMEVRLTNTVLCFILS